MRLKLRELERAIERVDRVLQDEAISAHALLQSWRNEHYATLDVELGIRLSQGIHAGDPGALAEWELIREAEQAYIRARAAEWIAELPVRDRARWQDMLGAAWLSVWDDSAARAHNSLARPTS